MGFRTILVHLGFDAGCKARLDFAVQLAGAHGAGLLGCYAATWMDVWLRKGKVVSRTQANDALENDVRRMEAEFKTICEAHGTTGSFVRKHQRKLDGLSEAALLADLCVLSIGETAAPEESGLFDSMSESLILATSCPVLVLPETPPASCGRHVLVAWKPRREAARAIRDALPLLRKAGRVSVLTIGSSAEERRAHDIRPFLAAHGIKADLMESPASDANAGEVILAQARSVESDTIVMGAYGHSRLREFVLGGATRHVLSHTGVPVLMSH